MIDNCSLYLSLIKQSVPRAGGYCTDFLKYHTGLIFDPPLRYVTTWVESRKHHERTVGSHPMQKNEAGHSGLLLCACAQFSRVN